MKCDANAIVLGVCESVRQLAVKGNHVPLGLRAQRRADRQRFDFGLVTNQPELLLLLLLLCVPPRRFR